MSNSLDDFLDAIETDNQYYLDNKIWVTRDMDQIPISKMTLSHIQNTMNILERQSSDLAIDWLEVFDEELQRRQAL